MLKQEFLEKCKFVAHKCGYIEAKTTENSLLALNYCADKRYIDGVELDIQLTKDNHLVVIHDNRVDKLSNGHGLVRKMTLAQLQSLDFNGHKIMTLEDALNAFPNDKKMIIEIKRPLFGAKKLVDKYYELIKKYEEKNIITICFIPDVLTYLKSKNRNLKTGILVNRKQIYNLLVSDTDFIFLEKHMLTNTIIRYVLNKNKKFGFFTLENNRDFKNIIEILEKILDEYSEEILFTTTVPYLINENNKI